MDVGSLRAELELDATQFRRDLSQAEQQFRQLGTAADRTASGISTSFQQAGTRAGAAADGVGAAFQQEGTRAEAAASGIGGAWQQAGSRAEGAASGIGGAFQQAGARAESAAGGISEAFRGAGQEGEQAASGIGGAFESAMGRAAGSAEGAGASGGGSFIAAFGSRVAGLGSKGGPIGLGLAAIVGTGALFGAKLADTVFDGFQLQAERDFSQAQFGFTDAQMEQVGQAAGASFGSAWGESVNANISTAGIAMQAGILDGDATAAEIQPIIDQLTFVSQIMGEEIPAVARAAGQMVKTGMVDNTAEAFDLLTAAQQRGLNINEDILDTMNEYGTQFRKVGIDGPAAMGLIAQAMEGGARDADIAADAIKEFSIRAVDGSEATTEAFTTLGETIGMTAEDIETELGKGGDAAFTMTDKIIDALGEIEDPVARQQLAVSLFGTQVEDLGGAFDKMDLTTAAAGFDATGKALEGMDVAGGGAAVSMESARNRITVAANEVKMKLAEAFAPSAVDFSTWVGDNQTQILNFFIELAQAAISITAGMLDAGGAMIQFGSWAVETLAGVLQAFTPILKIVEGIGDAISHIPGMGGIGEGIRDSARSTREALESTTKWGDSMRTAGGAMFTLADKIRDGSATLEDFQAAQQETLAGTSLTNDEIAKLGESVNALPRDKAIDVTAPGGVAVKDLLSELGVKVTTDNNKNIVVESPLAPGVIQLLKDLGVEVVTNNGKSILVTSNAPAVKTDVDNLNTAINNVTATKDVIFNMVTTGQTPATRQGYRIGPGGQMVPRADGGAIYGPGGPKSDVIPVLASNGEYMIQASSVAKYGVGFMDMLNAGRFADGGAIGYGLPPGSSGGFPDWVTQMGSEHGVTPSTYAGHQESDRSSEPGYAPNPDGLNRGIDWTGSPEDMRAFAEYLMSIAPSTPALEQVIYMDPNTGTKYGWAGNHPDTDGSYYSAEYGGHQDHVHTRQNAPLTGAAADAMAPAEIEIPVLTNESSKEDVARAIIAQGRKRGYSDEEIKAILATGLQESDLDPNAVGGGGAWQGVFQQDTSYEGRNDPNQNIAGFYDRLDERHKGAAAGDIWDDIFWLQQRPGDTSGASAVANGRGAYKDEIMSQQDSAGALFDQIAPSVGTVAAPGDLGAGAPAGIQQVYVVGGRLDGATSTPAATSTPSAPSVPAPPAPPAKREEFGRGPLPIVAYANGGTIPGYGNEDSELLLGMPGEEIISKGPAAEWRPLLKAINSGKLRKFAAGGTVGFGGYSDSTVDSMKPKNFYDWASLVAGGGFAAASIAMPYVNMAQSGKIDAGSLLPTMDTSANSVDGVSQMVGKVADEVVKQLIEIQKAVREGKQIHPTDPNSGVAMMLGAAGL